MQLRRAPGIVSDNELSLETEIANRSRVGAQLATFLIITLALSTVFWWLIISAGSVAAHGGLYVLLLMWCPAVEYLRRTRQKSRAKRKTRAS